MITNITPFIRVVLILIIDRIICIQIGGWWLIQARPLWLFNTRPTPLFLSSFTGRLPFTFFQILTEVFISKFLRCVLSYLSEKKKKKASRFSCSLSQCGSCLKITLVFKFLSATYFIGNTIVKKKEAMIFLLEEMKYEINHILNCE